MDLDSDYLELSVKFSRLMQVLRAAQEIHSTLDLDAVLSTFLTVSVKELETEGGTIYFVDPKAQLLESRHIISRASLQHISMKLGEGVAGKVALTGEPVVVNQDLNRNSEISNAVDAVSGYRTRNTVCFPLKDERGEIIGVLQLVNKKRGDFNEEDLFFLQDLSLFVGLAFRNAIHFQDSIVKARMEREILVARDIQNKLLPLENPSLPGYEVFSFFRPCHETAGDYYQFFPLRQGSLVALIDVSGKGVGAAMVAFSIHTFLSLQSAQADSLPDLAGRLNDFMLRTFEGKKYATAILLRISSAGEIDYVNAGHPPLIRLSEKAVVHLESTSPPLGLLADVVFKERSLAIDAGDVFCMFTDGYTETFNMEEEEFGVARLSDALNSSRTSGLSDLYHSVEAELVRFQGTAVTPDDRTMILLRRT